jgi:hypothetical protein
MPASRSRQPRPRKLVDTAQAWFWSKSWQSGEREASGDIAAGRTRTYKSNQEFLKALADLDKLQRASLLRDRLPGSG